MGTSRPLAAAIAAVATVAVAVLAAAVAAPAARPAAAPPARSPAASSAGAAARRTPVVAVAEKVSPAVVNIAAESMVRDVDPFFGGIFTPQRRAQSLGS